MKNYFMENLSWPKINDYLKVSNSIIIPIGATEESGNHLPISMDTRLAVNLCEKVSEQTKCLVAPTMPIGHSEWFMEFPGTLSFSYDLLIQILQEYCDNLIVHGFKKLIFISPHGQNATAIGVVGRKLRNKGVIVSMINPWKILDEIVSKKTNLIENNVKHAGEIMTSVALAICPNFVDMDLAVAEYVSSNVSTEIKPINSMGESNFKEHTVNMYLRAKELTSSGSMGDPRNASAKIGKEILNTLIDYTVSFINEIETINPKQING
jgi:creatinine amidohydrolase